MPTVSASFISEEPGPTGSIVPGTWEACPGSRTMTSPLPSAEKTLPSPLPGVQSGSANCAPVVAAAADWVDSVEAESCAVVFPSDAFSAVEAVTAALPVSLPGFCVCFDPHPDSRSPAHKEAVRSVRQSM